MEEESIRAIIISVSSDIGLALAADWSHKGWEVFGTFRSPSTQLAALKKDHAVQCVACDLSHSMAIDVACRELTALCPAWDVLVLAPGDLEPIGDFKDIDIDRWEQSVQVNLLGQLRIVHRLLNTRRLPTPLGQPRVLFFAGGGTNNAVRHYSSYTLSKIALMKMCELLDAELPDTQFVILGPGCVKTKIHEPTLRLGAVAAGANYQRTVERLRNEEHCTPMSKVVACCTWLATTSAPIGGRNFSVFDAWETSLLERELIEDVDMYKLRRAKNSWRPMHAKV